MKLHNVPIVLFCVAILMFCHMAAAKPQITKVVKPEPPEPPTTTEKELHPVDDPTTTPEKGSPDDDDPDVVESKGESNDSSSTSEATTHNKFNDVTWDSPANAVKRPKSELGEGKPGGLKWMDDLKNKTNGTIFMPGASFSLVCHSPVYCDDALLLATHQAIKFNDSKQFVDMRLKYDPEVVVDALHQILDDSNGADLNSALQDWMTLSFDEPDSAFVDFEFDDWAASPEFLTKINDKKLRTWAGELHVLWKELGKKTGSEVYLRPERYSQIFVPNPVIVPGDRFKEFYYWDSYWTFLGLTHSEMISTVRGMLENFLAMIRNHGFIPNGGRVYYEKRSQPPMFVIMVKHYLDYVKTLQPDDEHFEDYDLDFLQEYADLIEDEVLFWLTKRSVHVEHDGETYTMFRYATNSTGPRPESFKEDIKLANMLGEQEHKQLLYNNLHSACESGWDFSSRWFKPAEENQPGSRIDTRTRDILPVDLNALMCYNTRVLAEFTAMVRNGTNDTMAEHYFNLSREIGKGIEKLMYDPESGAWFDYDHELKVQRKSFHPSSAWPLWLDCYGQGTDKVERGLKYLEYLKNSSGFASPLNFPGGIPTSMVETGEQWDFPNAWPPLVHTLVMALDSVNHPKTKEMAYTIAEKWIHTNYVAYKKYGAMFEKYNVTQLGAIGSGGEYSVQKGFGWTNGVAIDMLVKYGSRLTAPPMRPGSASSTASSSISVLLFGILMTILKIHF